jgi:hypothetical protein
MTQTEPLATVPFTDGTLRPVYADALGQYILDDGESVYGVWWLPVEADDPVIVEADL